MTKFLKYFLLFLLVASLSSCITVSRRSVRFLQDTGEVYPKEKFTRYKLQKNDEVKVLVSSFSPEQTKIFNTDLSYRIQPDGTIDIPFVEKIPVEGLTLREAKVVVQKRLRETVIPDAVVNMTLATNVYYSLGKMGKASHPIYKENMTIFQALAQCGQIDLMGDFRHFKIIRQTKDGEKIIDIDIRSASIVDSEYYYIRPNDILYVPTVKGSFYKTTNLGGTVGLLTSLSTILLLILSTTK